MPSWIPSLIVKTTLDSSETLAPKLPPALQPHPALLQPQSLALKKDARLVVAPPQTVPGRENFVSLALKRMVRSIWECSLMVFLITVTVADLMLLRILMISSSSSTQIHLQWPKRLSQVNQSSITLCVNLARLHQETLHKASNSKTSLGPIEPTVFQALV